jgi:hypothetical protein
VKVQAWTLSQQSCTARIGRRFCYIPLPCQCRQSFKATWNEWQWAPLILFNLQWCDWMAIEWQGSRSVGMLLWWHLTWLCWYPGASGSGKRVPWDSSSICIIRRPRAHHSSATSNPRSFHLIGIHETHGASMSGRRRWLWHRIILKLSN